jgi:hypothetical protein
VGREVDGAFVTGSKLVATYAALAALGGAAVAGASFATHYATAAEVEDLRQTVDDRFDWLTHAIYELALHPDHPDIPPPPPSRRSR